MQEAVRLHAASRLEEAAQIYRRLLASDPQNIEALSRMGLLCGQRGRFGEAEQFLRAALERDPARAEIWLMLGFALRQRERLEESAAALDRALAVRVDFPEALVNRAAILMRLRRYADAEADYDRLLALDPGAPFARGSRLMCRRHRCSWDGTEAESAAIVAALDRGEAVVAPFDGKAIGLDPKRELSCARIWARDHYGAAPLWRGEAYRHERIRIAYVSANFHAHAVASLLAGVIERHDRTRFEPIAISFGPDEASSMRARLERGFERFLNVRDMPDGEIARLIRNLEADIAIDLMGYTEGMRPGMLARRPAPVQVNWLGYPGTMGFGAMDYLIADRHVAPANEAASYSEQLIHLPACYLPADNTRAIARPPSRTEVGLPPDGFVFCAFHAAYKITPEMFSVWMRLLREIEGSVLWMQENANATDNLKREAARHGVAPERLVFASFAALPEEHLGRLALADLFLDTSPYNAHATAVDSLWAGVPVLTLRGQGFAGRVGASLAHAIEMPGMIAGNVAGYEAMAIQLARDPAELSKVRVKLAENRMRTPLFDTERFTRNLEEAFAEIHARQQRGEPPSPLAL